MKTKTINLETFLQKITEGYDPFLSTQFSVSEKFSRKPSKLEMDRWKENVVTLLGLNILEVHTTNKSFFADLVIRGGFPEKEDRILKFLKKVLALDLVDKFSVFRKSYQGEAVNLGMYLDEMKLSFDDSLYTSFTFSDMKDIKTKAELVFIQKQVKVWVKMVEKLGLIVSSAFISTGSRKERQVFEARLKIRSGLSLVGREIILDSLKEILGFFLYDKYPFFNHGYDDRYKVKQTTKYAKNVPISCWVDHNLGNDQMAKERIFSEERVKGICLKNKVKFLGISYTNIKLNLSFSLKKDMESLYFDDKYRSIFCEILGVGSVRSGITPDIECAD